ncbi:DUF308 domain-containing protein [Bisgaard Taxon 10/6]|uniref:HdeD family acid-resistance protein n=1 Tax=Exercitatus varius TaxID=67857 RepID=UPI00294B3045|nr:DUF308 domain-containing protein [Exercitatus varius]MDG2954407.1 DUF308 domain-containing protein [Exercitatus varius]
MKNTGLLIAGILSLIGGFFAWLNPFAATLTVDLLAGWFFIFSGIFLLYSAFSAFNGQARGNATLIGVIYLLLGYFLIAHPLQGIASLTVLCGVMLLFAGIFRLAAAFKLLQGNARWVVGISGALSLLLALLIFSNFSAAATVTLGIFLAIELISNGISLLFWSSAEKGKP